MPGRQRKIGTAALAVAVGIATFALILGSQKGGDTAATSAAGAPTTTITQVPERTVAELVARGFIEAYGDLDETRALGFLADDADIRGLVTSVGDHSVTGTVDDVRMLLSLLRAQGYEQLPGIRCAELGNSQDTTTFRCGFAFHDIRSDELGLGPFRGSYFLLTVRDWKIVEASEFWDISEFSPQVWEPFAAWVSKRFPRDAAVMYTGSGARLSEESIRLWEKRSREYAAVQTSKGAGIAERFMAARNAYDGEKAMSLLAERGVAARLLWGNGLYPYMPTVRMNRRQAALALEAERIYGVRYADVRCRQHPVWGSEGRAQILCSYRMDSRLRQISGLAPARGSFGIGVHNGRIDYTSFPWLNVGFPSRVPEEGAAFAKWLEAEHPEAGGPMRRGTLFRTLGQELTLILTRKSVDLLARYLDEYERAAGG